MFAQCIDATKYILNGVQWTVLCHYWMDCHLIRKKALGIILHHYSQQRTEWCAIPHIFNCKIRCCKSLCGTLYIALYYVLRLNCDDNSVAKYNQPFNISCKSCVDSRTRKLNLTLNRCIVCHFPKANTKAFAIFLLLLTRCNVHIRYNSVWI